MTKRIKKLFVSYESSDIICAKIHSITEWNQKLVESTNVIILRYHIPSRSIFIAINHEVVGGGDYLLLGSVMFNGYTNSLIQEPNMKLWKDYLFTTYLKLKFKLFVLRNIYFKTARVRSSQETILQSKIDILKIRRDDCKTKYALVYTIMKNIIGSLPITTDDLVCWLPVGFKKTESSPNNNVGIIPFCFTRKTTLLELATILDDSKNLCIGSRQALIESYQEPSNVTDSVNTESCIKSKIDVVLTLANIMHLDDSNDGLCLTDACAGMYYKMNSTIGYPFYVFGLVMNDIAHISYSINDKECDIPTLKTTTRAIDVTNDHVFRVNNVTTDACDIELDFI